MRVNTNLSRGAKLDKCRVLNTNLSHEVPSWVSVVSEGKHLALILAWLLTDMASRGRNHCCVIKLSFNHVAHSDLGLSLIRFLNSYNGLLTLMNTCGEFVSIVFLAVTQMCLLVVKGL